MLFKSSTTNEKLITFLFVASLLVCSLIYSKGLESIFVLDDGPNIGLTQIDELSLESLRHVIANNQSGIHPLSRAIPTVSFSLTYLQYGNDVSGYKYHNLLLHLLCGIFVFLFIFKLHLLFDSNREKSLFIALLASSIWLLHPLLVSTTLYSVQRITQFSTLFTLLALTCAVHAKSVNSYLKKGGYYFIAFPVFLILGLMSKETAALIPLYIVAIGYALRSNNLTSNTSIDKTFFYLFGVITTFTGIVLFLLKANRFINYQDRDFTLIERLLSQSHIVVGYVKNIVLPKLSSMGLYVDDAVIQKNLDAATVFYTTLIIIGFLVACYWLYQKKFIGILSLFFLGHILESTIFPLELAFEHRNHFPSIGIIACIAYAISNIHKIQIKLLISFFIISLYTSLLFIRVGFWSDEHEWQKTSIAFHPTSIRANIAHTNYLSKYFGNPVAYEHLIKAIERVPDSNILKIVQITYLCGAEADNTAESAEIISKIAKNLETHTLQVAETAVLLQLSEKISIVRCTNIDTEAYFDLIDKLINKRESLDRQVGNLYAVRGLLFHASGFNEQAGQDFFLAFKTTKKPGHLLAAIKTLVLEERSYERAIQLVEEVNQGKLFNLEHFPTIARRANEIVKNRPRPSNHKETEIE